MNAAVQRYRALADLLDRAFRIPGTDVRFGLDPLLGFVPGIGDALTAGIAGYIIVGAVRLGAPRSVVLRMLLNVLIDLVLGAIPLVGDVFDVAWHANARNARLLEHVAAEPGRAARASRSLLIGVLGILLTVTTAIFVLGTLVINALVGLL